MLLVECVDCVECARGRGDLDLILPGSSKSLTLRRSVDENDGHRVLLEFRALLGGE